MIILDTDHLSILDRDTVPGLVLSTRLSESPDEDVAVSIITYEEQMRGWLSYVAGANSPSKQAEAYRKLRHHLETFRDVPIIDYDEVFLPAAKVGKNRYHGPQNCSNNVGPRGSFAQSESGRF